MPIECGISTRGGELHQGSGNVISESGKEPDHSRGVLMIKLSWRREARPLEPKLMVNPRLLELETAKEILEEVFHARHSEVEEMIQRRLEEENLSRDIRSEKAEWPQRVLPE